MILALELFGAFLGGGVSTAVAIFFVGRRIVRKKLGGLLDMTAMSKMTTGGGSPSGGFAYSTRPRSLDELPPE